MLRARVKASPRLASKRDDDERLPIHWAVSYNQFSIVELLVSRKDFDPDVQARLTSSGSRCMRC